MALAAAIDYAAPSVEKLLGASKLFGRLPAETRALLAQGTMRRTFTAGQRIYRAGEPAQRFHLLLCGMVKVVSAAADGSEAIVGLFGPRESLGDPAVLERGTYWGDAIVTGRSVDVLAVEAAPVLALASRNVAVADAMTRALLDHTRMLQEKITVMSAGSVPKRLATLFLSLAERFGDEREDGALTIPITLSRGELACLIGARVETTIRIVRRLETESIIETHSEGFVIRDVCALVEETRAKGSRDE